jgi:hypothetical protein
MRALGSRLLRLFSSLVFLAFSAVSLAQNQPAQNQPASAAAQGSASQDAPDSGGSLAAAAKASKAQKAGPAKRIFTDDDMEVIAGPLPRLKMDGPENADDVVAAIKEYRGKHTPAETEEAVHIWYDRYDEMLAAAIRQNQDIPTLRSENMTNGYLLCQEGQDYQKCANRQMAEQRGAQSDQKVMTRNAKLEVRVQHSLMKVRNGLCMMNLRYPWFKIRTTNDIDSF